MYFQSKPVQRRKLLKQCFANNFNIYRLDCYKEVTAVLDHLRHRSNTTSYSIPVRPGCPPAQPSPALGLQEDNTKVTFLYQASILGCFNESDWNLN